VEAITWFIVGGLAALIGAVAGVPAGPWAAYVAAAVSAAVATAVTKRLAAYAAAALVVAVVGSWAASDAWVAVAAALASFVAPAAGAYGLLRLWRLAPRRVDASRARRIAGSAVETATAEQPKTALSAARIAKLVDLAATDTTAFRAEAARLSADQRQQLRNALRTDDETGR
jgi:hypothetical protein